MDIDYVYAAIIHPNRTDFDLFADADAELQNLCVRIYNDWMSEFCSVDDGSPAGGGPGAHHRGR